MLALGEDEASRQNLVFCLKQNTIATIPIKSYHIRGQNFSSEYMLDRVDEPMELSGEFEIWAEGVQRRELSRVFFSLGREGRQREPFRYGRVSQVSSDGRQTRVLRGWDPEHPFALPLEYGRNAAEFGQVEGTFAPADPVGFREHLSRDLLLWTPFTENGRTLLDASAEVEFKIVLNDAAGSGVVQLRAESTTNPSLQRWIGTLVSIDTTHGWMISRVETSDDISHDLLEVVEFSEVLPGVWIPTEIRAQQSFKGHAASLTTIKKLLTCDINSAIPGELLVVRFPEGSRVIEMPAGKNHIWGVDSPLASFDDFASYQEYVFARAREYQSRHRQQGHPPAQGRPEGSLTLLIVNFVLVGLLILFTILRRRLARAGGPPPEAP